MLSPNIKKILDNHEFVIVATSDGKGTPNAAPMFLVKTEDRLIYLVDYTMGTTYRNLKANPQVSVSISDHETLIGFKFNGHVKLLQEGPVYKKIVEAFKEKTLTLSIERILSGIRRKKSHGGFEVQLPEKFVVYEIHIEEVVEIEPGGLIKKLSE